MNSELVPISNETSAAITGTISSSLFSLARLRYLDLSFNDFMYSKIPSGFSNLTRLTYLNLSNAMFSGPITTQFSNLTFLGELDLSCSYPVTDYSSISLDYTSSLEIHMGAVYSHRYGGNLSLSTIKLLQGLHNLRQLRLVGVDLSKASQSTQDWASPIASLSSLNRLLLSNCKIFGNFPARHLLNITNLFRLTMDFNSFSSPIPSELANLTSLSVLDLTKSKLQGPIPRLPQLKALFLADNSDISIDLHSLFAAPWPHLEYLDISATQVQGSLPTSFANTTSLRHFRASNCLLQGPIPDPIMNLSKLETLALGHNNITGHISPTVSNLKSLKFLYMTQNSLEGPIPSSICNISSLELLTFAMNSLTGHLPACISQLRSLQYLDMTSNNMNGMISSLTSLFKYSSLKIILLGDSGLTVKVNRPHLLPPNFQPVVLDVGSCHLGGRIPDFISNMTQLTYLRLADNNLSGAIPFWLFNLPNLGFLDLSSNNFQGLLPPHIKLHSYFGPTTLSLANNQLQGPLPPLLQNIEVADLSGNSFTGYIPAQRTSEKIRYLSLSRNKLHGQIPPSFCHLNNVMTLLDLSKNHLGGKFPTSIGNCSSLIFLNLGGNNLSGEIPNELQGAKHLSFLDLESNHFSGPFPYFIRKLRRLSVLKLGNNRFEGRIPPFIGDLKNLHILELQSNSFNDSIPPEINNLENLQYLDFSSNKLSGPIPEKLHGLKMITTRPQDGNLLGFLISATYTLVEIQMASKGLVLHYTVVRTYHNGIDLSQNCLTGNIPSDIGLLQGLYMLNLSHNCLRGEIPKSIGNMSKLESLDLSFNSLSGKIPPEITFLDSLSTINFSYNNLSGKIPTEQHFDTLNIDGSAYIGNKFLCAGPTGISCDNNDSSSSEFVDVEDRSIWHEEMFYVVVVIGYGVGLWGFFGVIYLMKGNWRNNYWMVVDSIALGIIRKVKKQD